MLELLDRIFEDIYIFAPGYQEKKMNLKKFTDMESLSLERKTIKKETTWKL